MLWRETQVGFANGKGENQMQLETQITNGVAKSGLTLERELYGDEIYEYYPLGKYIVAAPGICGGRPTFKYTRLEVRMILALLSEGDTIEKIVANYTASKLTSEAVREAIWLASQALIQSAQKPQLIPA